MPIRRQSGRGLFAGLAGRPEAEALGAALAIEVVAAASRGRNEMVGYLASTRGGGVRVRVAGDRAILGGRAVTVMRGELAG